MNHLLSPSPTSPAPSKAAPKAPVPPPASPRAKVPSRKAAPARRFVRRGPAPHQLFTPETKQLYLAGLTETEEHAKEVIRGRWALVDAALAAGKEAPFKLSHAELRATAASVRRLLARARASVEEGRRDRAALAVHQIRVELARIDCISFTELVIKTEVGRKPIRLTEMHREWHEMADGNDTVVIWAHIGSGKSLMLIAARSLWELGRDPELRIGIVSETSAKAKKLARPIAAYIQNSRELREVFPALRPSMRDGEPWNTTEMTVSRPNFAKDASITIVSAMRPAIASARLDRVFFDDILSHRTARKPAQQEELRRLMQAEVMGRMGPDARLIAVNTAWKMGDYMNELAALPGAAHARYGVYNDNGQIRCPWITEEWVKKQEARLQPIEAARQLHVQDREDGDGQFDEAWIKTSLLLGDGVGLVYRLTPAERAHYVEQGCVIVTGVDVAASRKKAGGRTAFVTLLVWPDGEHQILWVECGQFSAPEIRDKIIFHHMRYGAAMFVETVGVQKWMLEMVGEVSDVPVAPFQTGANKVDPLFGVGSIALLMRDGKLLIPSKGLVPLGDGLELLTGLRTFRPDKHPPDSVMALWIAKEGGRQIRWQITGTADADAA